MRSKVLNAAPERTVALVFERGDEVMSALKQFAREHDLAASRLTGIGAFESATLGYFDWERRDYLRIPVDEQVEVLTMVGDITLDVVLGYFDPAAREYKKIPVTEQVEVLSLLGVITLDGEQPKVHAHVVLGRRDGSTLGGHLLEARVRPTLEVIVVDSPSHLRREHDPVSGLALIRVSAA
jgi:predicted DNA-binding protein with PD1-like motif